MSIHVSSGRSVTSMSEANAPWQLRMFRKTLKKRQRLRLLERLIGRPRSDQKCLLITCGDNNGAMNYHLRRLGGIWYWAELESRSLEEMSAFLGDEVRLAQADAIPYPDETFDVVVAIDTHEHIEEPEVFTQELARVSRTGGHILITVPGGDGKRFANRLKRLSGMKKEQYGHVRDGFSSESLQALMTSAGIVPFRDHSFSRFFTELIELGINLLYVKVLTRSGPKRVSDGTIAPQTEQQLKSIEKTYRLYSMVYPVFWLVSQLDMLLFFTRGYVVLVEGRRAA